LNHHFGGFDNSGDRIAFLKLEFVALRRVIALSMRLSPTRTTTWAMMSPNLNLFDLSTQFVSG